MRRVGSIGLLKNEKSVRKGITNPPLKYVPKQKGKVLSWPTLTRLVCSLRDT